MEQGDHVLFSPEDRYEVEVRGDDYIILRERDIHAVAAKRLEESSTGLYLCRARQPVGAAGRALVRCCPCPSPPRSTRPTSSSPS